MNTVKVSEAAVQAMCEHATLATIRIMLFGISVIHLESIEFITHVT